MLTTWFLPFFLTSGTEWCDDVDDDDDGRGLARMLPPMLLRMTAMMTDDNNEDGDKKAGTIGRNHTSDTVVGNTQGGKRSRENKWGKKQGRIKKSD